MDKNFKPLYTPEEAKSLTESLIDQDTKFNREIEALINTDEAKEILKNAYNNGDDNAKASIAAATEEQFLDKYAPDGSPEEKKDGEKKGDNEPAGDDDFLDDASGLDIEQDNANQDVVDDGGSEDDADENIFDDGGSEDDNDNIDMNDNPFAQATSGDDNGELTDQDNSQGNPFLESKKPKNAHSLNESRKASRMSKTKKMKLRKMNEAVDPDEIAEEIDDMYYGKIFKAIEARIKKFPKTRDKFLYLNKVIHKPELAKSLAEKLVLKLGVDLSSYGKEGLTAFTRVVIRTAGDIYDLGEY